MGILLDIKYPLVVCACSSNLYEDWKFGGDYQVYSVFIVTRVRRYLAELCRNMRQKGAILGGLARILNESSRLYSKFTLLYMLRYFRFILGLTSWSAEVACHYIGTAK
jgi:hypothetical protein